VTCHTGMPSRSGLLDRVEIVAHAVDAAAGGRDDIVENSLGTGNTGSMATARKSRALIGWHLDEMVVRIAGKRMYLWRAVDHEGEVLDMLVQSRRDSRAALRLMRKLLRKQGFVPKLLVTDKLRSYGSAFRQLQLTCLHEKQSRREFASACTATRNQDAAVQIGSICPALPPHACRGAQHLQSSTPSRLAINAADLSSRSGERMAECGGGNVIAHPASGFSDREKLT
jgi:IS1 family transposase